jgi:hypothetical protein
MRPGIEIRASRLLALLGAVLVAAACGPAGEVDSLAESKGINAGVQPLAADNGLSLNGLSLNGLNLNGLNLNGLNRNGLATTAFSTWFNGNAATSPSVMWYLYGCAAPLGSTLTWTNPTTGIPYLWVGVFGLAPDWVGGKPATVTEQQVITACLAAHANKYGVHVPIAVEGRTAKGVQIPILPGELSTFSVREACFFGNLFNGEGVFLSFDQPNWAPSKSSARGCAVDINGVAVNCAPIVITGDECKDDCKADSTGTFWETCTWNRKTYKPLTTRIRPQEVYTCGDGVCQFTEHCGTGTTASSCKADCGLCP